MIDLKLKEQLDEQQSEIIGDTHKYLCVSACPGAGKTYTLVNKVNQELQSLKDYQGIIACSFTKESSKEIKERLRKINKNIDNCYIDTIDSFIMNLIIKPFLNRYLLNKRIINKRIEIMSTIIDNDKNLNLYTRLYDKNDEVKKEANEYAKCWLENLKQGIYSISFPTYMLAESIVKMKLFNQLFAIRFPTIYVDEAQDLNYFQHRLLKALKENTDINIVLFGDPNQSIYQFRGARPELFNNLKNEGYYLKKITLSVRCHPSILFYANRIFEGNIVKNFDVSHVQIIDQLDLELLRNLNDKIFILVETNDKAVELYEKFKDSFDVLYSKKLDKMPNDYNLNQHVLDELIKYYLNYDNIKDRYKYPIEDLMFFLRSISDKLKEKDFKIKNKTFHDFMIDSINILNIAVSEGTVDIIEQKLMEEKYMYYYYIIEKNNKIMTIHSSKGLENENVIIYLSNTYKIDEIFKNKLFVAITRAKNNVYIYCEGLPNIKKYIIDLLN